MGRILVVEDDPGLLGFLETALKGWGHEVDVAQDGQEAYQKIYLARPVYDLILCDLVMPSMQGQDLLRRVAGQLRNRTPVIVISGKDRAIDALGEIRDWAFRVLRKPCEVKDLQVSVEQAALADEVFATLMGEDVDRRKQFIQANAADVRFLDI